MSQKRFKNIKPMSQKRFKNIKLMSQKRFYACPNIYYKCKKYIWLYGRGQERKVPSM